MSVTSMRRIIKSDLKLLPYKMRKRQYLTLVQKQKRLSRANILLRHLKGGTAEQNIVFFLMQNSSQLNLLLTIRMRVYAKSSVVIDESVRTVYFQQKQFLLLVQAAASKSWKSTLIFVEQGLRTTDTSTLTIFWFQLLKI